MNEGVDPDVSFRVQLDTAGKLYWVADDEGTPVVRQNPIRQPTG
jgi:hypothetical protein